MSLSNRLILKLKRSESWPFRLLKKAIRFFLNPILPPLPRFILPPFRLLSELHYLLIVCWRFLVMVLYSNPAFQARCTSVGRGLDLQGFPFVRGHVEIHVGNNVIIGGKVSISSGAICDHPRLIFKDRSGVGWNTSITVNQEVVLEEDVIVSYNCNISDSDGHRREADLRAAGVRPDPKDVRPVRICKHAWIGNGSYILKGVTIGEGAIVAANSVVISNIPPYCLAMGNPAEVLIRNFGRPSTFKRETQPVVDASRPAS